MERIVEQLPAQAPDLLVSCAPTVGFVDERLDGRNVVLNGTPDFDARVAHKGSSTINLSRHKVLSAIGARVLFLPPHSPIEVAFSRLKALIGKAAARTCGQLRATAGELCGLFSDKESDNYIKAAEYETI